jgi:hypothetical protein
LVERRSPKPNAGGSSPSTPASLFASLVLAVLAALPFAFAVRPQLADYPSHLARYHVMVNGAGNAWLAQYYNFDWALRGNLGVDLLIVPLAALFGLERAAWLIALLLPVLVALGIVAVVWSLRRAIGPGPLLAFAAIWSPAMAMGFANFSLSLAMALFAFALWVRTGGWPWRTALFVPLGLAVWLAHSAGWGVLGVMVFGYEWHRERSWRALLAPWPLFPPFLLMLAEPGAGSGAVAQGLYGGGVLAYKLGIWVKALADVHVTLDLASVAIMAGAVLIAARRGALDGRLGWAALLVAMLSLAMPRHFGGGDLADLRLTPVALMLGCMAIDVPRPPRWLLVLAPMLFLVRLGVTSAEWREQSQRLEAALPALQHLPQGAKLAFAVPHDSRRWGTAPHSHAGSYATVYRNAMVNSHFALPGVHMLAVKGRGADFADPSQQVAARPGQPVDLARFAPASRADYLWYVGDNPLKALPPGARVIHRAPGSVLARLAKPGGQR